ncbi:nitrite reductase small subunit NirD [Streptomyces samsunensis]|uniref:nitrite reductase small subunit NirD n=1 Tax=Streptomyces malaysiensis TaxID=92644 RepID=UPI0011CE3A93|nr:nitrite reductase small subunit NirD [Streptomyces samsunensis]MCQ6244419.1 nitrite reductase small subunit NirD [Streptomyces malaysiensis]NUH39437.1 nitrite reductase small subunit NirD [Streptomyces samsunensis]
MTLAPGAERTAVRVELLVDQRWFAICELTDLTPGRGVAALLPDGAQVAVFLDRSGRAYAIGNRDPFSGAYVLSRGLLGSADGRPFVASPLLKQRFDLETGWCLDDEAVGVQAYATRTRPAVSAPAPVV